MQKRVWSATCTDRRLFILSRKNWYTTGEIIEWSFRRSADSRFQSTGSGPKCHANAGRHGRGRHQGRTAPRRLAAKLVFKRCLYQRRKRLFPYLQSGKAKHCNELERWARERGGPEDHQIERCPA